LLRLSIAGRGLSRGVESRLEPFTHFGGANLNGMGGEAFCSIRGLRNRKKGTGESIMIRKRKGQEKPQKNVQGTGISAREKGHARKHANRDERKKKDVFHPETTRVFFGKSRGILATDSSRDEKKVPPSVETPHFTRDETETRGGILLCKEGLNRRREGIVRKEEITRSKPFEKEYLAPKKNEVA